MGTAGRPGVVEARLRVAMRAAAFRAECAELDTEAFIGRVLDQLPLVTVDDFGDPAMRPEALATPEGWQEWLTEYTGRMAWAGEEQVPETNFMRRAAVGDTTNGYVKTDRTCGGCAVWEKVSSGD